MCTYDAVIATPVVAMPAPSCVVVFESARSSDGKWRRFSGRYEDVEPRWGALREPPAVRPAAAGADCGRESAAALRCPQTAWTRARRNLDAAAPTRLPSLSISSFELSSAGVLLAARGGRWKLAGVPVGRPAASERSSERTSAAVCRSICGSVAAPEPEPELEPKPGAGSRSERRVRSVHSAARSGDGGSAAGSCLPVRPAATIPARAERATLRRGSHRSLSLSLSCYYSHQSHRARNFGSIVVDLQRKRGNRGPWTGGV